MTHTIQPRVELPVPNINVERQQSGVFKWPAARHTSSFLVVSVALIPLVTTKMDGTVCAHGGASLCDVLWASL